MSNDDMIVNSELQRMWMEAVVALYKALSMNFPQRAEENDKKPQSG
jgi:hypothetical protein